MPYTPWPVIDFSGGKNESLEPNLIADNQCEDVQNCIVNTIGKIENRRGQAKLNSVALGGPIQGLHSYYYGTDLTNRRLVVVANGVAYYWDSGASSFVQIKTGLNATAPAQFVTCINYMVGMNGVDAPWKWDGTTVSALANAPATGKCPVLFKEKVFCIVDADTIDWSDNFAPETWPGVNTWDFDRGDGDELSAIFVFEGGNTLLACKKRSFHRLIGSDMNDFRSNKVESNYGVAGPRAGVVVEPYFYYISECGIMRWNGVSSTNLIDPPRDSGLPGLPALWASVNKAVLDKAVAWYVDGRLWFHVAEGASTTNNLVLVYDLKNPSWWPFRGITAACMVDFNDGASIKSYTGHTTAGYVVEQNTGYNDMGVAISSYWIGKDFDGGDPVRMKKFRRAFVVDAAGFNDAVFGYRLNRGDWQSPTEETDINNVRKFGVSSAKSRFFQPRISHSVLNQSFVCSGLETLYKIKKAK